jgi:type IV pilus assembly protein PilP
MMRTIKQRFKGITVQIISIITIGLLAACKSSKDVALTTYINQVKKRSAQPIEPIPEYTLLAKYSYPEHDTRRSPFKPKEEKKIDNRAPNISRPKQPLEEYPLDALKFVGVLKQGAIIWCLISKPDAMIIKVKVGDYMGKNFGRVISVSENSLTLEETIRILGKWERKITIFNLNASK